MSEVPELPKAVEAAFQEISEDINVLMAEGIPPIKSTTYFLYKYARLIALRDTIEGDLRTLQFYVPKDNRRVKAEFAKVIKNIGDLKTVKSFEDYMNAGHPGLEDSDADQV